MLVYRWRASQKQPSFYKSLRELNADSLPSSPYPIYQRLLGLCFSGRWFPWKAWEHLLYSWNQVKVVCSIWYHSDKHHLIFFLTESKVCQHVVVFVLFPAWSWNIVHFSTKFYFPISTSLIDWLYSCFRALLEHRCKRKIIGIKNLSLEKFTGNEKTKMKEMKDVEKGQNYRTGRSVKHFLYWQLYCSSFLSQLSFYWCMRRIWRLSTVISVEPFTEIT